MNPHADAEFDREVKRLTERGLRQRCIAKTLGVPRDRVRRAQIRTRCRQRRELTGEIEVIVLGLSELGIGSTRVATILGTTDHRVRCVRDKFGVERLPKPEVDAATREKLVSAILRRENFAIDLAEKYGIAYKSVLRLAHQALGVSAFRRSRAKDGPLTSNFPARELPTEIASSDG